MKKLSETFDDFVEALHAYKDLRVDCLFIGVIMLLQLLTLALIHQITGEIPVTTRFNLIFWSWHLPFAVSSMWDIFVAPVSIFLMYKIRSAADDSAMDTLNHQPDPIYDLAWYSVAGGFMGGIIVGVMYVLPCIVLTGIGLVLAMIVYYSVSSILHHQ